MPRTATVLAAREDDETTTHVDELIQRGRGQGFLSLPELRDAFEQARMSPTEARSIIRELTEAGVQLGNEPADAIAPVASATVAAAPANGHAAKSRTAAKASSRPAGRRTRAAAAGAPEADATDPRAAPRT